MRPVIALVGRPNVGKSTLFNRLTRSRDALVANIPGLTRDRQYGQGMLGDRAYIVIDTGGITGDEQGIDFEMAAQSLQAVEEADAVLLLMDAKDGLTPVDANLLEHLRKSNKAVSLVINKVDGLDIEQALAEFYVTGMSELFPITATQGRGVRTMMEQVLSRFPVEDEQETQASGPGQGIKIAIAGCPNVGKSTLVNRMLGEERVVVFDQPGTTRDSIYIPFERHGHHYTLIDTAGIRRRGKTRETAEKFSVVKSLQAIQDANVVVMVIDARKGVVEQDLHLLDYVIQAGRGLVIALNKWDGMDAEQKAHVKTEIKRRLSFADFAQVHFISAKYGTAVGDLYKSIHKAYDSAKKELSTNVLTRILQAAVAEHEPPSINNRRIKLRYAHTGGHNPPIIIIHGKQTEKLPDSYRRYLEKYFRQVLKLEGTPVRVEFKSSENPFTEKEKDLRPQQVAQKRRIRKNRQARKARVGS
ncbi:MAG: ribosome biogenesis GTPase Der [Gammaproteobacteria bacterium]|jgi:GTP-binding protein